MIEGKIIAIEGIDGAGKKTQSEMLVEYLKGKGVSAEVLSFPDYNHPLGMVISDYLHKRNIAHIA